MSIARWDPFYELSRLERNLNRWSRRPPRFWEGESEFLTTNEFAPPVDVYEDEDKLAFKMEIPGVKPEDLDVRLDGNMLTISGERNFEKEEKRENFRRVERQYGSFCRSFELPASADRDHINANFENGLLKLEVPKRAEARGRQIQIGAGESKGRKEVKKVA
jgi:HSP20 family protein